MTFPDMLKEYFRWTTNRPAEGFLSWQHLLYATLMVGLTVALALFLGRKYRDCSEKERDRVMKIAAIVMVSCELFKIVLISVRNRDPFSIRSMLPLFLCSINLFTIPFAAFGKGRWKELGRSAVAMYGMLCCLSGAYLAGNYFSSSPVLSFDPMMSVTTHCIAGFAGLYLFVSHLVRIEWKKGVQSLSLIFGVEVLAFLANLWNRDSDGQYESNYMFLDNPAGTPFDIIEDLVGGIPVLYTLAVGASYLLYGVLFILVALGLRKLRARMRQGRKTVNT